MKKTNTPLTLLFLLTITTTFAQWQDKTMTHGGKERQYRVYKSPNYTASKPASLVFTLHGLGDNATNFSTIGMNVVADTANIIVVVPQAWTDAIAGTSWNAGTGMFNYYPNSSIDDVNFISTLIDSMKANYAIAQGRVYACGFSMGGFMTNRLAVELNDKFNAFATVSGTFGFGLPAYTPNNTKIATAHFHGTADGTVPYAGNDSGIGADSLVNFWVNNAACNTTPVHTALADSKADGYTVDHYLYSGGQNGTEVEFFKVTGADHVWLTPANDISYTIEIWKFFNKHRGVTSNVGIETATVKNEVTIYPNPTNDKVHIQLEAFNSNFDYTLSIVDITGKKVIENEVVSEPFTVSTKDLNLKSGMYLFQIKGNSEAVSTKRVVLE